MQLSQIILTALAIPAVSAFAPPSTKGSSAVSTKLNVATGNDNLNGWVPDSSKFAFGLPGTLVREKKTTIYSFTSKLYHRRPHRRQLNLNDGLDD
jgi:hypothetical protein